MSSKNYVPTIGLEIHAELSTKTKMFCNSKNDPDEKTPNLNICPICMGYPGTLPTINKEAVKSILKIGIAVGGKIADYSEFDRKNYFYPDIPKSYQISQYKFPLVSGGSINGIAITRVHLEEDTARSSHGEAGSLVDFNRAGVPLMELVTEPVIKRAEDAANFAKELQLLLRTLGVGEANMEKGEMRVEANVSVSATSEFGTKVEVKNLNSFKVVAKAIEYEIKRQIDLIENGGSVVQETRGFDENKGVTFSQRKKESSHDYRYFPDPDLPKLKISDVPEFEESELKKEIPELPWERRNRLINDFGIKSEDAELYTIDLKIGDLFEKTASQLTEKDQIKMASNYISSDLLGLLSQCNKIPGHVFSEGSDFPKSIAKIILMISSGDLSSRGAKDVLKIVFEKGGDPRSIAEESGLILVRDTEALKAAVNRVIESNEQAVKEYKSGKANALQYLVGQAMKETKGSGDPRSLMELIKEILG